jgi:hypothetical protein
MSDYLSKPIRAVELGAKLEFWLSQANLGGPL